MTVTHVNPATLHSNPNFSQATVLGAGRTLYVGGQNGTDVTGAIVAGGAGAQCAQAMRNVLAILVDQGASQKDVAKLNVYYTADASLMEIYDASGEVWGDHATAITILQVYALARPDALVEVDAIASLD